MIFADVGWMFSGTKIKPQILLPVMLGAVIVAVFCVLMARASGHYESNE